MEQYVNVIETLHPILPTGLGEQTIGVAGEKRLASHGGRADTCIHSRSASAIVMSG